VSPCLGAWFLWAGIFALVCTQAPLYYSNQNQYFLHGLAQGGLGHLNEDWLANTLDPTPVFSKLIEWTYRFLNEEWVCFYYVLIFGVYRQSLVGLGSLRLPNPEGLPSRWLFLALLLLVHSAAARYLSGQLFRVDYPWYFQAGLAGQYVLGPTFQPSVFGVLLLLSLYLFASERPWLAMLAACVGASVHSTYLLSAGLLVLGYQIVLWRAGRRREALLLGTAALALVMPVVAYSALTFAPTSPEAFAAAQHIIAQERIPHHCVIGDWLDGVAIAQIAWVVLALWLLRRQPLFPVLVVSFTAGLLLTLVQAWTGSNALALLFPWRVSIYLVPLATAVNLAALVGLVAHRLDNLGPVAQRTVLAGAAALMALLAFSGAWITSERLAYPLDADEERMFAYVRAHVQPGDVYLIPVELPGPRVKRGAFMSDFVPQAARKPGTRVIPAHLQRFRLHAGAPIFVDYKAIPYQDVEVLEWRRRVEDVLAFYRAPSTAWLAEHGITHILTVRPYELALPGLEKVYEDGRYRIWRVAFSREPQASAERSPAARG